MYVNKLRKTLYELNVVAPFLELPANPLVDNYTRTVANACYSLANPVTFDAASLALISDDAAHLLELEPDLLLSDQLVKILAGRERLHAVSPYSGRYGGH